MTDPVHAELDGGLRTLVLDRPPVNALDTTALEALTAAFDEARDDHRDTAVLLTGTGRAFSAGLDTKAFAANGADGRAALAASINRMLHALVGLPRPVVAAVNGHALGGGFVVALACDARVAVRDPVRLGLTEVQAGVAYPTNAMEVVRAKLPSHLVDRLVLRGDVITPEDALGLGLVDELADDSADTVQRAATIARHLAGLPAFSAVKAQFRRRLRDRLTSAASASADPVLVDWEAAAASG